MEKKEGERELEAGRQAGGQEGRRPLSCVKVCRASAGTASVFNHRASFVALWQIFLILFNF